MKAASTMATSTVTAPVLGDGRLGPNQERHQSEYGQNQV
jgi:hypothetical protein